MMDPEDVNTIIFDFDGTLCSGRYFEALGKEALNRIGQLVFGDSSTRWADPWMRGDITSDHIASYLSKHLSLSQEDILSALRRGCANMPLNQAVLGFARQQRTSDRKTALVTANMDVFTEVVVPAHDLGEVFDLILNTADHGTLDKCSLWRTALGTFGPVHAFSTALLIEDSPRMVSLFRSFGGWAYRYEGDEAFESWLHETGLSELTARPACSRPRG
jgi:FMN phosphatase YigB (HAD superfamily)